MPLPHSTSGIFARASASAGITFTRRIARTCTRAVQAGFALHLFYQYGYSVEDTLGPSMLPTLEFYGGYVMISRSYRRGKNVKVGDLVSFYSVVEPRELVIKRVVGLEGDYVLRDTPEKNDIMIQVNIRCFQI